jgi:hypothetical protein
VDYDCRPPSTNTALSIPILVCRITSGPHMVAGLCGCSQEYYIKVETFDPIGTGTILILHIRRRYGQSRDNDNWRCFRKPYMSSRLHTTTQLSGTFAKLMDNPTLRTDSTRTRLTPETLATSKF